MKRLQMCKLFVNDFLINKNENLYGFIVLYSTVYGKILRKRA